MDVGMIGLGRMGASMAARLLEAGHRVVAHDPAPGEPWILNDPYTGGTHLPDLTIVTRHALGYAVSRAHHADVGGAEPGSMPAWSRTLDDEGDSAFDLELGRDLRHPFICHVGLGHGRSTGSIGPTRGEPGRIRFHVHGSGQLLPRRGHHPDPELPRRGTLDHRMRILTVEKGEGDLALAQHLHVHAEPGGRAPRAI